MSGRMMGARVKRMEDPALLTGRGRFTDDIHLPHLLEAAFVRSSYAHARIREIDTSVATAMPGVFAIVTNADLPDGLKSVRVPFVCKYLSDEDQEMKTSENFGLAYSWSPIL